MASPTKSLLRKLEKEEKNAEGEETEMPPTVYWEGVRTLEKSRGLEAMQRRADQFHTMEYNFVRKRSCRATKRCRETLCKLLREEIT